MPSVSIAAFSTFAARHQPGQSRAGTTLVMVGLSFGSRYPWRTTIMSALLFVLLVVQVLLAHTGIPALSALHGLNALVMIGLGGYLTGRNWAFRPQPVASAPAS